MKTMIVGLTEHLFVSLVIGAILSPVAVLAFLYYESAAGISGYSLYHASLLVFLISIPVLLLFSLLIFMSGYWNIKRSFLARKLFPGSGEKESRARDTTAPAITIIKVFTPFSIFAVMIVFVFFYSLPSVTFLLARETGLGGYPLEVDGRRVDVVLNDGQTFWFRLSHKGPILSEPVASIRTFRSLSK